MRDAVNVCETSVFFPSSSHCLERKKRKEQKKVVLSWQEELFDLAVALVSLIGPSYLQPLVVTWPAPCSSKGFKNGPVCTGR